MPKVHIPLAYPRGQVIMRGRYNEAVNAVLKTFPGCRYAPDVEQGAWLVPEELVNKIGGLIRRFGAQNTFTKAWEALPTLREMSPTGNLSLANAFFPADFPPMPWQPDAVARALRFGSQMFHHPTGSGKTISALAALNAAGIQNALIICPAIVRPAWQQQAELFGREVLLLEKSSDAEKIDVKQPGIVACSWELAGKLSLHELPWRGFVADEIHMGKEGRTARSAAVYNISASLPGDALRLGLTATPAALEPRDIWHQLAILWPGVNGKQGRWGTFFQFAEKYAGKNEVSDAATGKVYGYDRSGLNEENLPELQERLSSAVHTVTEEQTAPFMPPFHVESVRFKVRDKRIKEASDRWLAAKGNREVGETAIIAARHQNAILAIEMALNSIETHKHVAIVCYFHETADAIMKLLEKEKGLPVFRIPSGGSPAARLEEIEKAKSVARSIAVMTMKSIGVGVDTLTAFTHAIGAELYFSPEIMTQWIGRFSRLSSKKPSLVTLLCLEGTISEFIARAVVKRARASNKLFGETGNMARLEKGLKKVESDQDFMKGLLEAAMSGGEE